MNGLWRRWSGNEPEPVGQPRVGPRAGVGRFTAMERPPPDPGKLLDQWNEWESGQTPPGRVMSNLKTSGLPDLLRSLAGDES